MRLLITLAWLVVAAPAMSAAPVLASDRTAGHFAASSLALKSCTPGYSPCIAPGSDVDCWGGSGNGPRYTKPHVVYKVTKGKDIYGLDADHDGLGCEPAGR